MPQEYTHQLPFNSRDITAILEVARLALSDGATYSYSEIEDGLDMSDEEITSLRNRLQSYMERPDPSKQPPAKPDQELVESLEWITRCAKMPGPCGTTVYFINDATMDRAKAAVAKTKGGAK
jgi:hypothetical protein